MKKQLLLILMTLLPMVAWADESGTCGDNLTWTYYESTHSLVIAGSGDMYDYSFEEIGSEYVTTAPWNKYRNDIVSVTMPEGMTSIGTYAFLNCSSLLSVPIGKNVKSIGNSAFSRCSGLTSVTIPNSVTSIGNSAFYGCSGLTSITISNSVTSIGFGAFQECISMTSVTIPNSVKSIGGQAFYGCISLTSVTIPNSVASIYPMTFCGCSSLTSVTIPNSVTSIDVQAFEGCKSLTAVHITDLEAWCNISFDVLDSNPLTYAHHLYLNGEEVKDLVIPNSVTAIGNYAFKGCRGLTSVTIPNSLTSIESGVFFGCSSLTSVEIPNSVTSIGGAAFGACSSLNSVTIGNGVTFISEQAFYKCSGLTAVYITDLKAWCKIDFFDSDSNPLTFAHHLYLNGKEVKDLVIPNSVTSIGQFAFNGCRGLTSVIIPNSVTYIGGGAFYDCSSLTSVVSLNPQPPTCYTNTFSDYSVPLYVPQGCSPQYMEAEGWSNFMTIRELNGDDIYLTINDGAKGNLAIRVDHEKPYMTLRVQPESGWHIYSMTFNGETVTGEIDSDGTYTTPVINENSDLNIVYAQGASSAPSLENPHIHFSSTENSIVINGTTGGESISVCSLDGKCLAKVVASGYTTEIPLYSHQTYLIKINQSVFKVSM